MAVLKFLILLGILLYASIKDIREHEVPDTVWKLIAILGLVNNSLRDLPSMLLGAALVFLPQIIPAVINTEKAMGGADIKISTACAFLLGAGRGLAAFIIGLTLFVVVVPILRKVRHEKNGEPFPMVPFLSVGTIAAYLM